MHSAALSDIGLHHSPPRPDKKTVKFVEATASSGTSSGASISPASSPHHPSPDELPSPLPTVSAIRWPSVEDQLPGSRHSTGQKGSRTKDPTLALTYLKQNLYDDTGEESQTRNSNTEPWFIHHQCCRLHPSCRLPNPMPVMAVFCILAN